MVKRSEKTRSKSVQATKIEKDLDVRSEEMPSLAAKSNTLHAPGQSATSSGRKKRKDKERRTSTPLFGSKKKAVEAQNAKSAQSANTKSLGDSNDAKSSSGRKSRKYK